MRLLRILLTPSCWIRLDRTNKILDKWMQEALKNPKFSDFDGYMVTLNGWRVWVQNYPYACAYLHNAAAVGLPSRSTVFDFYDALIKYLEKENTDSNGELTLSALTLGQLKQ